jgi:hypothetical protein
MLESSARRALQATAVVLFGGVAVLGAKCPGATDADDEPAECPVVVAGVTPFKCINSVDPKGYTCISDARYPSDPKVAYACLGNGGTVRYFDPALESVSAFESRNGTCASKPRCTR